MKITKPKNPDQFQIIGGHILFLQQVNEYILQKNQIEINFNSTKKNYYPLEDNNVFDDFINLSTPLKKKGLKEKSIKKEVFDFVKKYGHLGFLNFYGAKKYRKILGDRKGNIGYERVEDILNESKRLRLIIQFYKMAKEAIKITREAANEFNKKFPDKEDYYPEDLYDQIMKIYSKLKSTPRSDGSIYTKMLTKFGMRRQWYPFKYFASILNEEYKHYLNKMSFNISFGKTSMNDKPLTEKFTHTIKLNSLLQFFYVKLNLIISEEAKENIGFCDVCEGPYLKTNGNKKGHAKCIKRKSAYKAMGRWKGE